MNKTITLTRNELYKLVWSKPISNLAPEYAMSGVGLAKLCKRHQIPLPIRGHWSKIRYKKKVSHILLPKLSMKDSHLEKIRIQIHSHPYIDPKESNYSSPLIEKLHNMKYEVVSNLDLITPFASKTYHHLTKGKEDERGVIKSCAKKVLGIKVSKTQIERASKMFDVIVRAAKDNDWNLEIDDEKNETFLTIEDEKIVLCIEEKIQRKNHELSTTELQRVKRDEYYKYKLPQYDYHPTGLLTFKITNSYEYGLRKCWGDGKIQRLETCIPNILEGIVKVALQKRHDRLERLQQQELFKERQLRAAVIRKEKELEKNKVDQLLNNYENWVKADQLRLFIDSVREMSPGQLSNICEGDYEQWHKWCSEQADRLDPLLKSPYSILDE